MTTAAQHWHRVSLGRTGGLDRLLRALHVVRAGPGDVRREATVFILFTWVPLAMIGLVEWLATRHLELLFCDLSVHVRFLVAAPLLLFGEDALYQRCNRAIEHLSSRVDSATLERIGARGRTLRAAPVDVVLLLLAFFVTRAAPRGFEGHSGQIPDMVTTTASAAEGWFGFVALPLATFLLLRVLWFWVVWSFMLASFARLDLHANAINPDESGGLRFLSLPSNGFVAVVASMSSVIAGAWATQIVFGVRKFSPESSALPLGVLLASALVVTVGPLLAFMPQLYRARLEGNLKYHALAEAYTDAFEQRWMNARPDASVLGTPDIQSLADLANGHDVAKKMRVVPFGARSITAVTLAVLVPMFPLVLLEVPFTEVLKKLLGLILGHGG